jgi:hypothetical protein
MAVHAVSGTLVANTVASNTLTSWQPYVLVTLTGTGTAGTAYVTVDGTTPTVGGADETAINMPATAGVVTVALKNLAPRPVLQTTTPLPTDPSATEAFTTAQTVVKIISQTQLFPYAIELSPNPGGNPVFA